MQLLQILFAIIAVFSITLSNACLVSDATYNIGDSKIVGTMTDNRQKTCTFSGTVEKDKPNFPASCIEGFTSYISTDLQIATYVNHGKQHILHIAKEGHSPYPQNQYYTLSARLYC
ncbi:hypothetical protein V492_03789 [Pseudogymnoascus sp. VKM F-4246]|nr:hypothetical protein V492_03789 [Pseudogymnoascus sp. VKM F-4246]